ncbi:hypothetical protein M8J77_010541 [Diaphorina citri]|nr:hypothetical protein M8J77_010541 [Diaphorina citri]
MRELAKILIAVIQILYIESEHTNSNLYIGGAMKRGFFGAMHQVPDALSRIPQASLLAIQGVNPPKNVIEDVWYSEKLRNVREQPERYPDYFVSGDLVYKQRLDSLDSLLRDEVTPWKLVLRTEQVPLVLQENHDRKDTGGHCRVYREVPRYILLNRRPGELQRLTVDLILNMNTPRPNAGEEFESLVT